MAMLLDFLQGDDEGEDNRNEDGEDGEDGGGGAPTTFKSKQALIIFLVDASQAMLDTHDFADNELVADQHRCEVRNRYTLALSTIAHLCRDKVKKGHTDHVGIVLYNVQPGDEETRAYKGVRLLLPLGGLTCQSIMFLRREAEKGTYKSPEKDSEWREARPTEQPFTAEKGHLEDALCFAQNQFHSSDIRDGAKHVCVLTCSDDPVGGNASGASRKARRRALMKRCHDIKGLKVVVDVYPLVHTSQVVLTGLQGDSPPSKGVFRAGVAFRDLLLLMQTTRRRAEEALLEGGDASLVEEEARASVDSRLMYRGVGYMVKQLEGSVSTRSMGSITWKLGDDIGIAVKIFKLSMPHPTAKSISVYTKDNRKLKLISERFDDVGNMLNNNRKDQIGKVYKYGQESVHVHESDIADYKNVDTAKGISLLGFVPVSSISPTLNLESPYFMYPHEALLPGSTKAFVAMWSQMHETGMAAICSARLRATSTPRRYACVVSRRTEEGGDLEMVVPDGMHFIPLPWNDDVRMPPPTASIPHPSEEVVKAAAELISTIRMDPSDCAPENFRSPAIHRHVNMLEALSQKITQDEEELAQVEADLLLVLDSDTDKALAEDKIAAFKAAVDPDYDDKMGAPSVGSKRPRESKTDKKTIAELKDADGKWKIDGEADLQGLTIPNLKEYLKEHGLKLGGAKPELIKRICEHYFKS